MKKLIFDVYRWFDEVVFEARVYDGEMRVFDKEVRELSYTSAEGDIFKGMKELQEEYGAEYEVLFRVQE